MKHLIILFLTLTLSVSAELKERTWTSIEGKQITARLISSNYETATMEIKGDLDYLGRQNRKVIPLERFSVADRNYIKKSAKVSALRKRFEREWSALEKLKAVGNIGDRAILKDGTRAFSAYCEKPQAYRPRVNSMSRIGGYTGGSAPNSSSAPTKYATGDMLIIGLDWDKYAYSDKINLTVIKAGVAQSYRLPDGTEMMFSYRKYIVAEKENWISAQIEKELSK